jgi:NADH-quinone oxidoreductase subunit A
VSLACAPIESRDCRRACARAKIPWIARKECETPVLTQYWPILLFLIVAGGLGIALLVIGLVLGPRRPDAEKLSPYECGFEAFEDARLRFDVRYYLIAILFIIFDLEIAFLFPWATVFAKIGVTALVEMGTFLFLLIIGFVYVWKKGALEWD